METPELILPDAHIEAAWMHAGRVAKNELYE